MGYDKLERNLIDIIKEEQAKLGFFKEDIRLYYPLSSLNAMLEMQETDIRELAKKIRHELEAKKEKMGDTQIRIQLPVSCHTPASETKPPSPASLLGRLNH